MRKSAPPLNFAVIVAALIAQLDNFSQVIRGTSATFVSAREGVQSVRVVEAIHQAAIDRKVIILKTG